MFTKCCEKAKTKLCMHQDIKKKVESSMGPKLDSTFFKMFTKCCEKAKTKLCMHQDIKNKVESNFGPMEDILQETQLTEHEFFPLVMQLLHGKEMDYMTGGM